MSLAVTPGSQSYRSNTLLTTACQGGMVVNIPQPGRRLENIYSDPAFRGGLRSPVIYVPSTATQTRPVRRQWHAPCPNDCLPQMGVLVKEERGGSPRGSTPFLSLPYPTDTLRPRTGRGPCTLVSNSPPLGGRECTAPTLEGIEPWDPEPCRFSTISSRDLRWSRDP